MVGQGWGPQAEVPGPSAPWSLWHRFKGKKTLADCAYSEPLSNQNTRLGFQNLLFLCMLTFYMT